MASSFLNAAGTTGRVTISEQIEAAAADLDALDAALGELRAAGWPAPPKIQIPRRMPNSAAGTASPTGYVMR